MMIGARTAHMQGRREPREIQPTFWDTKRMDVPREATEHGASSD